MDKLEMLFGLKNTENKRKKVDSLVSIRRIHQNTKGAEANSWWFLANSYEHQSQSRNSQRLVESVEWWEKMQYKKSYEKYNGNLISDI